MPQEIERKYLVKGKDYKENAKRKFIRQGYLSLAKKRSVRIRRIDDKAWITIKGKSHGASRREFEYEIPVDEADIMLDKLCKKPLVEKYRYLVQYEGNTWEVDEFLGDNAGLAIAEIELNSEDQSFIQPPWIGEEVTGKPQYYNVNLVKHPFVQW